MLDVGTQFPNLLGHTLAPFWFFSPKSLDALMCPQDFSSRKGLVASKVWDIIKKLKPVGSGRWPEMKFQDSVLLTKQEGSGRKVHLMVDRPELLKK